MRYETLYDGTEVPVIGLGTWRIGGGMSADYSRDDYYVDVIQTAIEMGYTHIDTAEMYGSGHTEELVGQAIAPFDRHELFITTKVWSSNLRYADVLDAFEGSLRRLGTDYVDLYLIHWPNSSIPLEETFRALNELVAGDRARYVGVSNFSLEQLKRAEQLSDVPIATNQVEYHVLTRRPRRNGVLTYCQDNDILLTAYEPLGKGRVLNNRELQHLAEKYDATPAQVAINWLVRQPKVITIPKSDKVNHLQQNLEAVDLELAAEDVTKLNELAT